jgi:alpha-tubulin suppressor-like RCC1 family protein
VNAQLQIAHQPWRVTPIQVAMLGKDNAQVSADLFDACVRKTGGTLWCWGVNNTGALGDGTTLSKNFPVEVSNIASAVSISANDGRVCAQQTDRTLWCWGFGPSASFDSLIPKQVTELSMNVAGVAVGPAHNCALLNDGSVWCWGKNGSGQVDPSTQFNEYAKPTRLARIAESTSIAAGGIDCARKRDGTLWCWGQGELGDGAFHDSCVSAVGCGPVQVGVLGTEVQEISIGDAACATKTDGSLWCWGGNIDGEVGDGTTQPRLVPVLVMQTGTVCMSLPENGIHASSKPMVRSGAGVLRKMAGLATAERMGIRALRAAHAGCVPPRSHFPAIEPDRSTRYTF